MLLVVDNGSVYTKNLIDFLSEKKINFQNHKHDEIDISKISDYDSFILSGRRENNKSMNAVNSKIIQHAVAEKKNLLGICYGAEILAITLGGTIKRNTLEKGEQEVTIHEENPLCQGKISVFESHTYEISRLDKSTSGIASSNSCKYEIIRHNDHNIYGTQFHPEMSSDGQSIISAFTSL